MDGWNRLIRAAIRTAAAKDIGLTRDRSAPWLVLRAATGRKPSRTSRGTKAPDWNDLQYGQGVTAAARALSLEVCQVCGRPGDPVRSANGSHGTRCGQCRRPGDEQLPRPAWQLAREPGERRGRLEDVMGADELRTLMDAAHAPAENPGWPRGRAAGDPEGDRLQPIGATGWTHLWRAGFRVLLALECAGQPVPWRLGCAKERLGRIRIHSWPTTPLFYGVTEMLAMASTSTCIFCGRPGRMRWPGWIHPACDSCHQGGVERYWERPAALRRGRAT